MGVEWTTRSSNSSKANVPQVDLSRTLRSIILQEDDNRCRNPLSLRYPTTGGTGQLWVNLTKSLPAERIHLGASVVSIDANARTISLADGNAIHYRHLVSCLPLDRLLRMLGLPELETYAAQLKSCGVHAVGFGLRGELPEPLASKHWINIPDEDMPFHKLTILSNCSAGNVPRDHPCWSILCDVCESSERPIDQTNIVRKVIAALRKLPFFPGSDHIDTAFHTFSPFAYTVPSLGRDEVLGVVQSALLKMGIWSRGRFGGWKYEVGNMDHSFMQGVEAIDNILFGIEEMTYFSPSSVSQGLADRHPVAETAK